MGCGKLGYERPLPPRVVLDVRYDPTAHLSQAGSG